MAETFLDRIMPAVQARLAERMSAVPLAQVRAEAAAQVPALDLAAALRLTDGGIRAIAEFKRASPSRGVLCAGASPQVFARNYAEGGAAAISVLTEQDFFQGSLDDLRAVKRSPAARHLPVLRKDFIIEPYQVVEARAAGADSYLLIVALLDDATLRLLIGVGRELRMEPLVEVHGADEACRAVAVGARIIGVNARDLRTFQVDTTILRTIRPLIPADRIVVAESGIATSSDVMRLRSYGAQAMLVGETLMRGDASADVLRQLLTMPPIMKRLPPHPYPVMKLCGMRTPADALAAYTAGADIIGLVFAPSKRQITREMGRTIVRALPANAFTVGVFVPDQAEIVQETIAYTGVQAVQAPLGFRYPIPNPHSHSGEPPARHQSPDMPIVPMERLACEPLQIDSQYVPLIDSAPPGVWGGAGRAGDWRLVATIAHDRPVLLAGGLTSANVADAIRQVQPWGVDVSSGIEGPDGQKDPARMRAFVQAVRGYGITKVTKKHGDHEEDTRKR